MRFNSLISSVLAGRALCAIAATLFIYLFVVLISYGFYDGYLDHGEPIVVAAAYRMLEGAQVYPSLGGPTFTSNLYGPFLYLANGLMLWIFGGSVASGKLIGIVATGLTVLVTINAFRNVSRFWMLFVSIAMFGYILICLPFSIWNRPDPLLLLVSALGVLVARSEVFERRRVMGWLLVGGLGGIACSFKIYGPLFLMPVAIFMALRDRSFFSLLIMSVAGTFTALIPFVLPVFSLSNYFDWFSIMATKSNDGEMVTKALRYGVFFLLPTAVLIVQRIIVIGKETDNPFFDKLFAYAISMLFGAASCIYLASKPGAGMYYVLPFAPVALDIMVRTCMENVGSSFKKRMTISTFAVLVAAMLVTSVPIQKRYFNALEWDRTTAIKNDLHAIMLKYKDKTIQMGVGNLIAGYHNTLQKSELIFAENPYTVDFGVMMETSKLGIPLSNSLIATISDCDIDIWLIPVGEVPLEITGYYGNKVVDKEFKEAFNLNYTLIDHSKYYDIWMCSHSKS
jgi:hypothetical protein